MGVLSVTRISLILLGAALLAVLWSCAPPGGGSPPPSSSIQEELTKQLSNDLASSDFSASEVLTIVSSGEKWVNDNVSDPQNAGLVLPAYLAGSMAGVGSISPPLDNDTRTLEAIGIIVASVVGSVDSFESQITASSTSRIPEETFNNLLATLVEVAINALKDTGLSEESLADGVGKIVEKSVSSLDDAAVTGDTETASAVGVISSQAVQQAAKLAPQNATLFGTIVKKIAQNSAAAIQQLASEDKNTLIAATETAIYENIDSVASNNSDLLSSTTVSSIKNSVDEAIELGSDPEIGAGGGGGACDLNGFTVPNGISIKTYENISVTAPQTCESVQETRICSDGDLSGSFVYTICNVSCEFNGSIISHGESVTAYQSNFSDSCSTVTTEQRTCSQGDLTGSFEYASCNEDTATLSGTVETFSTSSAATRSLGRTTAQTNSTTLSIAPVKSLVSLYLLIDEDFKYPVAKIKTKEDGSYSLLTSDVIDFLLDPPAEELANDYNFVLPSSIITTQETVNGVEYTPVIKGDSSIGEISAAFKSLGTLQVRALYVSEGKAKVITAMADPSSSDPVRVDPIVSRVTQQLVGKLRETVKSTLTAVSNLDDANRQALLAGVMAAVQESVDASLEEVKSVTTFEVPEGTDLTDPEALLEVGMDASTAAELADAIASTSDEVTIDTAKVAIADEGKLADTLTDEEKGAFDKLAEETSSEASSVVTTQVTGLSDTQKSLLQAEARKIKAEGLRKFFLTLGFPVVLAESEDGSSVVAVSLKVPPTVDDAELPGAATFGDRSVRHFLIKAKEASTAPDGWDDAPVLADQLAMLMDNLTGYQSGDLLDEELIAFDDRGELIDRVRVFHRFQSATVKGMPLVSMELVDWMAKYDNQTVTVQDVANQIANITEWEQERSYYNGDLPVFAGEMSAPSTGASVKATSLVAALTRSLGADARTTAFQLTDNNANFWVPFAAKALAEQINRNAETVQNDGIDEILPKDETEYLRMLKGLGYETIGGDNITDISPSPAYTDARATVARGLVAALPQSAYGKTLSGQTPLNAKQAVFFISYLLELQFVVDRAEGLLKEIAGTDDSLATITQILPNIENFKHLKFTSDAGVAEVVAKMMAISGPEEGQAFLFAQEQLHSGEFLETVTGKTLANVMLPEFQAYDPKNIGLNENSAADVTCKVSMFDGSALPADFSIKLLQKNEEAGTFSQAASLGWVNSETVTLADGSTEVVELPQPKQSYTAIDFTTSDNITFTAAAVPTEFSYAIRFQIGSYNNDLADRFFYADQYSASIEPCGPEGYVIGPDVQNVELPSITLISSTSSSSAEGIDFSNFSSAGREYLIKEDGESGSRDLMLVGTPGSGSSFRVLVVSPAKIARVKKSNGTYNFTSGDTVKGIRSLMGQSLSGLLGSNFTSTSISLSLTADENGGLAKQVLLLKASDNEYWLVELRFLDSSEGFLELAFARVNSKGRVEIPEAGFEQGPVDSEKVGDTQSFLLSYGDGLSLDAGSAANNVLQSAFDFDGTLNEMSSGVSLRYAGDDFLENIDQLSDLDPLYEDSSSIPVRLDGQGEVKLQKLSFDQQSRNYTLAGKKASATLLEHNDLVGVFLSSSTNPDYILRVLRFAEEGEAQANLQLELEVVRFATTTTGEDYRKAVYGNSVAGVSYPELLEDGTSTQVVYDGDFDGVPWLFDRNDEDPNTPGSRVGGDGTGLSIDLVYQYEYNANGTVQPDNYTTNLLLASEGLNPAEIDQISLTNLALGLSNAPIVSCTPPRQLGTIFVDGKCTPSSSVSALSVAFESQEGVGFFMELDEETQDSIDRQELSFEISFRQPLDIKTGKALICGDDEFGEEIECPAMPTLKGVAQVQVPAAPVGGFNNIQIKSGDDAAKSLGSITRLDSSRSLQISANDVSVGSGDVLRNYELFVSCAGFENTKENYFEPSFELSRVLPKNTSPSFLIERGMIPSGGGRSCQFNLLAHGLDDVGNSIGSTLHRFDLVLTGGFSSNDVDNVLKISDGSNLCVAGETETLEVGICAGEEAASVSITNETLSIAAGSGWTATAVGSSSLTSLSGGTSFNISNSSGQSFEVKVSFVRGSEAKLEFFLPPPTSTVVDGASLTLGGILIGQRSGDTLTPSDNITFRNAETKALLDNISLAQDGEYLASDSASNRTLRLYVTSGEIEWLEDFKAAKTLIPIVSDLDFVVAYNSSEQLNLSLGTYDASGENLSYEVKIEGTSGTLDLDNQTGIVTYTSVFNFTGNDSFQYRVKNAGGSYSSYADVQIVVQESGWSKLALIDPEQDYPAPKDSAKKLMDVASMYGSNPEIIVQPTEDGLLVAWQPENFENKDTIIVSRIQGYGENFAMQGQLPVASLGKLAGMTVDEAGNFYVVSAKDEDLIWDKGTILPVSQESVHRPGVLDLQLFEPSGEQLYRSDISLEGIYRTPLMSPMTYGTSRIAYGQVEGEGRLLINLSASSKSDRAGQRHQYSKQITLRASDGEPMSVYTGPSHSFDQRVIFDGTRFFNMALGDVGARGISVNVGKPKKVDRGGNSYSLVSNPMVYGAKGGRAQNGVPYQQTFIRMGNVQSGENGYPILFATEKSSEISSRYNDSKNLALIHVRKDFMDAPINAENHFDVKLVTSDKEKNPNFESQEHKVLFFATSALDKDGINPGMVWLTNYTDKASETVMKPKLVKISGNLFVALWEKWTETDYVSTYAMVIDEYGNIVHPATDLGEVRLQRTDEVVAMADGRLAWVTGNQAKKSLTLHTFSVNNFSATEAGELVSDNTPTEVAPTTCSFNGAEVASGSSVTAYEADFVESGQQCVSETRTCESGTLAGSFIYDSCEVETTSGGGSNPDVADLEGDTAGCAGYEADGYTCYARKGVETGQTEFYLIPPSQDYVLLVSDETYDLWTQDRTTGAGFDTDRARVAQNLYTIFEDDFDYILTLNQYDYETDIDLMDRAGYSGVHFGVSNKVEGIGLSQFNMGERYGTSANGRLASFMHMPEHHSLRNGPVTHELFHQFGAYFFATNGGHWGISGVGGGVLGGFDPETLVCWNDAAAASLPDKYKLQEGQCRAARDPYSDSFGTFANGGVAVPFSPMEQWMMGLIAPEEVPDLKFPIPTEGARLSTGSNGLIRGVARVETIPLTDILNNPANYSGDNVPKEHRLRSSQYVGPRSPSHQGVTTENPKEFTALMVLITKDSLFDQKKPNWKWENGGWVQKEGDTLALDGFHDDIKWLASTDERDISALSTITWQDTTNLNTREFGGKAYLSKPNIRFNFFQATNGLGRLNIDLSNSIRGSNTSRLVSSRLSRSGVVRPASGQEPETDAYDNDEFFAPDYTLDLAGYARNSRSAGRSTANTNGAVADTAIVLCSYEFDLTSTMVVSGLEAAGRSCKELGTLDGSKIAEVDSGADTDTAGSEDAGVTTTLASSAVSLKEGTSTEHTFVLNSQPFGTVTITFSSDKTSEAEVSPQRLSFDGRTWNQAQTLTITAPEDYTVDGDQQSTITYNIKSTFATDPINGKTDNFTVTTLDSGTELTAGGDSSGTDGTTDSGGTDGSSGGDSGGSTGGSSGSSGGSGIALDGTWRNLSIANLGVLPDVDEDSGSPMGWNSNYAGKPEIITEATDDGLLIGWNGEFEGEKKIVVSKIWSDGTDYELAGHQLVDSIGHIHGLTVDPDTGDFFVFSGSDEKADRSPSWDCCPKQKNGRLTLQKFDGAGKRYDNFDSLSVQLRDFEVADGIVDIVLDSHKENRFTEDVMSSLPAGDAKDYGFPAAGWPLLSPRWSSSTAFNDGKIAITMSNNTPLDGNGVRHQFARQIILRAADGLVLDDFGAPSHSFDQRVVADTNGSGFVGLDLGDVYPRGVVFRQWKGETAKGFVWLEGGKYEFDGLKWVKRNLNLFNIKGGRNVGGVQYNQVMSRLGNIAVGNNGYPVLFATENSNNFQEILNASRNLALVHVKKAVGNHDNGKFTVDGADSAKESYLNLPDGSKELTVTTDDGEKLNKGIVWLTEYSDKELYNVEKPKLAKIGADRFVVLWESWTGNKPWPNNKANYETTWAMVIDEFGNKIEEAWNVGEIRLERYSEVTVFQGNKVAWARGDQETSKLTLYVLSFDESAPAGERLSLESHDFKDTTVTVTSFPEAADVGPIVVETSQSKTLELAGRDFGGKAITYQLVTQPTKGTLQLNSTTGEVTYTNSGTAGADSFTYKVFHTEDSSISSTVATVTLEVRQRFAEPTNPISDLAVSTGTGSVTLNWSANAGDQAPQGYLVLCSDTPQGFVVPQDTKTLPEDAECADGKGAAYTTTTSYTWSNLGEDNYYFFRVYPYTNQDEFIDYNTEAPETQTNLTGSQYMVAQTHVIPLEGKTWELRDDGRPLKGPNGGDLSEPVPMELHLVANKKTLVLVESVEKKAGDTVTVTLEDGSTKQFTLKGPDTLPPTAGDPDNKYSTTAFWTYLDAEWVQPKMKLDGQDVNVGQPSIFELYNLPFYLFGANESTKDRDLTLDVSVTGKMGEQQHQEIYAKLPIAEFREYLHPAKKVVWPYLIVAPRSGGVAYVMESTSEGRDGFAPISAVMQALSAIKGSNGISDETAAHYYSSMVSLNEEGNYVGPGGGLGGGNRGAGDYSFTAIYHHEQGHAFNIPHAGQAYNNYEYPYEDGSLRGSGWGFDINKGEFLPNTMSTGAPHYNRCENGDRLKDEQGRCFSRDPMWGGGGDHPEDYVLQIFSDFNVAKMQRYFERTDHYGSIGRYTYDNVTQNWKRWNPETLSYTEKTLAEWDQDAGDFWSTASRLYGDLPVHQDTMVDTVVMTFSNPEIRDFKEGKIDNLSITQIYPPLLNYKGSAAALIDLDNKTQYDRIRNEGSFASRGDKRLYCAWGNCDFMVKLTYQDGSSRRFLLRGPNYDENRMDPNNGNSFATAGVTVPNYGKVLESVEVYLTEDLKTDQPDPLRVSSWGKVNAAPVAQDQGPLQVEQGVATPIVLEATDAEGDSFRFEIVDQPSHGTVTMVNADNGSVSYTSNAGFTGEDTFTFQAVDNMSGVSEPATVTLNVVRIVAEPAYGVDNLTVTLTNATTVTLNWTLFADNGGQKPEGFLVVCSSGPITAPQDRAVLSNDTDCSDGSGQVYLSANALSQAWTGLTPRQNYNFEIFAFSNEAPFYDYYAGGATQQQTAQTNTTEPTNAINNLSIVSGAATATLNWSANAGTQAPTGYQVLCSTSGTDFVPPVDLQTVADDAACADGSGSISVTTTSAIWNNLDDGEQYFFQVYPYTEESTFRDYKVDNVTTVYNDFYQVAQTHLIPLTGKTWSTRDDGQSLVDNATDLNLHLVANKRALVVLESMTVQSGDNLTVLLDNGSTRQFTLSADNFPATAGGDNVTPLTTTALWTMLDAEWVQPKMKLNGRSVTVGQPSVYELYHLTFDLFSEGATAANLSASEQQEVTSRLPIAEFRPALHPAAKVEWNKLVIPPDNGTAARVATSYTEANSSGSGALLAVDKIVEKIRISNGFIESGNRHLYGSITTQEGRGARNAGVIGRAYDGLYFEVQGQAFGLDSAAAAYAAKSYPYVGGSLKGSAWGFDLDNLSFLAPTMSSTATNFSGCTSARQLDNESRCFGQDPMENGAGDQPAGFNYQMFSDFHVAKLQRYFERTTHDGTQGRYLYDNATATWKYWNPDNLSFVGTTAPNDNQTPFNSGFPKFQDVSVDTIVMTISHPEISDNVSSKTLTQIYPPLLSYEGSAIEAIDLDNASHITRLASGPCAEGKCDFSVTLTYTDNSKRRFLLPVEYLDNNSTTATDPRSFATEALTVPNDTKVLYSAELFLTQDAPQQSYSDDNATKLASWERDNAPPAAQDQGPLYFERGVADNITLYGFDINNTDNISFVIVTPPDNGTLEILDNSSTNGNDGTTGNFKVRYTPDNASYEGEFSYKVKDQRGGESQVRYVTFKVFEVVDEPAYGVDNLTLTAVSGTEARLNWDLFPDNGSQAPHGFVLVCSTSTDNLTAPEDTKDQTTYPEDLDCSDGFGRVYLDNATDTYFWNTLTPRQEHYFEIFAYTNEAVFIDYLDSDNATHQKSVVPNTRPTAGDAKVNSTGLGPVQINLSNYATDVDNDNLTYYIDNSTVSAAALGLDNRTITYASLVLDNSSSGLATFVPAVRADNETPIDNYSFVFWVSDGLDNSSNATISIEVEVIIPCDDSCEMKVAQSHVIDPEGTNGLRLSANRETLVMVTSAGILDLYPPNFTVFLDNGTTLGKGVLNPPSSLPTTADGTVYSETENYHWTVLPKEWVQPGLKVDVSSKVFDLEVGPYTELNVYTLPVYLFGADNTTQDGGVTLNLDNLQMSAAKRAEIHSELPFSDYSPRLFPGGSLQSDYLILAAKDWGSSKSFKSKRVESPWTSDTRNLRDDVMESLDRVIDAIMYSTGASGEASNQYYSPLVQFDNATNSYAAPRFEQGYVWPENLGSSFYSTKSDRFHIGDYKYNEYFYENQLKKLDDQPLAPTYSWLQSGEWAYDWENKKFVNSAETGDFKSLSISDAAKLQSYLENSWKYDNATGQYRKWNNTQKKYDSYSYDDLPAADRDRLPKYRDVQVDTVVFSISYPQVRDFIGNGSSEALNSADPADNVTAEDAATQIYPFLQDYLGNAREIISDNTTSALVSRVKAASKRGDFTARLTYTDGTVTYAFIETNVAYSNWGGGAYGGDYNGGWLAGEGYKVEAITLPNNGKSLNFVELLYTPNVQNGWSETVLAYRGNVNPPPVLTNADRQFVMQKNETVAGVLTATDADNESITFFIQDNVTHGNFTFNDNGSFSYIADNATYLDNFSYYAQDNNSNRSVTGLVTFEVIEILPQPDYGVDNLSATIISGSQVNLSWDLFSDNGSQAPQGFLVVCTDNVTQSLNYAGSLTDNTSISEDTSCGDGFGVVSVDNNTTSHSWTGLTAHKQYFFAVIPFTNAEQYIDYNNVVGTIQSDNATPNTTPTATGLSKFIQKDTAAQISLEAYASDGDSDNLTFFIDNSSLTRGTAVLTDNDTGMVTFTPNDNVTGTDNFTFWVSDGSAFSENATVALTIDEASPCNNCRIKLGQTHILNPEGKTWTTNDKGDDLPAYLQGLKLRLVANKEAILLVNSTDNLTGATVQVLSDNDSQVGSLLTLASPLTLPTTEANRPAGRDNVTSNDPEWDSWDNYTSYHYDNVTNSGETYWVKLEGAQVQPGMKLKVGLKEFDNFSVAPETKLTMLNHPFYLFGARDNSTSNVFDPIGRDYDFSPENLAEVVRPEFERAFYDRMPISTLHNRMQTHSVFDYLFLYPTGGGKGFHMNSYSGPKKFETHQELLNAGNGPFAVAAALWDLCGRIRSSAGWGGVNTLINCHFIKSLDGTLNNLAGWPTAGLGGGSVTASDANPNIWQHEMGHALSLGHSDQHYDRGRFPYRSGSVKGSEWGFDMDNMTFLPTRFPKDYDNDGCNIRGTRTSGFDYGDDWCYKPAMMHTGANYQYPKLKMLADFEAALTQRRMVGRETDKYSQFQYDNETNGWMRWDYQNQRMDTWATTEDLLNHPTDPPSQQNALKGGLAYYMNVPVDTVAFTVHYPDLPDIITDPSKANDGTDNSSRKEATQIYPVMDNYTGFAPAFADPFNADNLTAIGPGGVSNGHCRACGVAVRFTYADNSTKTALAQGIDRYDSNNPPSWQTTPSNWRSFQIGAVTVPNDNKTLHKVELLLVEGDIRGGKAPFKDASNPKVIATRIVNP